MSVTSLCIPRVFSNITAERITGVIESTGFGKVERIDLVKKTNEKGQKFQRAFIHLESWDNTPEAVYHRNEIESGRMVKIVYDQPWFWLIGKSFVPKPDFKNHTPTHTPTPTPRIEFQTANDHLQTANDDFLPINIPQSVQPLLPPHPNTLKTFQQALRPSSQTDIINTQQTQIDQLKTQIIMLKAQLAMKDNELDELKASITTLSPSIYTQTHHIDIDTNDAPAAEHQPTPAQAEEYEDIQYDSDLDTNIFEDSNPSYVFKKALSMTHENDW